MYMKMNLNLMFAPICSVYSCHDSWEEKGVWYTIVSQKKSSIEPPTPTGSGQAFCFSMRWVDPPPKLSGGRGSRPEQQEQELWLSRPAREFQRGATDQWTYRLGNQGETNNIHTPAPSNKLFSYH